MSDATRRSPFAGIKLTDAVAIPAAAPGADQRLFSATPTPKPTATLPPDHVLPPRKQGTLEARTQGAPPDRAQPSPAISSEPAFDLSIPPYKNNTYAFTSEELWAIEDTEQALERIHDLKVTRYNLVRLGVHLLVEDFRQNGERSFVVRRLRGVAK